MKTNHLLTLAMTALLAAGCAQNEITEVSPDAAPAVGFNVYATAQTRGAITDNTTIQSATGFGVLAYYTGQSAWNSTGSFTPNYMYNQQVTYSSGWTYSPVKYWPNTEGDKISFFAYAPYESSPTNGSSKGVTLCANTLTGAPTLKFTLKSTASALIDLVATNATGNTHTTGTNQVINVTKRTTAVAFKFDHVLTRLNFKAKLDATPASGTHIFVTGMRLVGSNSYTLYSSATYKFADGTWDYSSATTQNSSYAINTVMPLTSQSSTVTGYTTSGIKITSTTTGDNLFNNNQYLFLIPPVNTSGVATDKVKVEIDYDIVTIDSKLDGGFSKTSTQATVSLPAGTLAKGKAYDYLLTIGLEEVQINASVTTWDTPTGSEAIPSVDASAGTAAAIITAIGTLNTTKNGNANCNYFVVNVPSGSIGTLNINTATVNYFVSGDQIELNFAANPGITGVTTPSGWTADKTSLSAAGKIILKKN